MKISDTELVHALDTETTGTEKSIDRVRSIGIASGTREAGIIHRAYFLIDTNGVASNPDALAVHKIPDNLKGGIPLSAACTALAAIIGDGHVIAHNAVFDIQMIIANLLRDNIDPADFLMRPPIDTMIMARSKFPNSRHNLDSVVKLCNIQTTNHRTERHDALEDASLTFMVWRSMTGNRSLLDMSPPSEQPTQAAQQPVCSPENTNTPAPPQQLNW